MWVIGMKTTTEFLASCPSRFAARLGGTTPRCSGLAKFQSASWGPIRDDAEAMA